MSGQGLERWLTVPAEADHPVEFVEGGVGIVADGSPPPQHWADLAQSVEIRAVVLRACRTCGGKTALVEGEARCPQHGSAPTVDLGLISARYKWRLDPRGWGQSLTRIRWALTGRRAARARTLAANRTVAQ